MSTAGLGPQGRARRGRVSLALGGLVLALALPVLTSRGGASASPSGPAGRAGAAALPVVQRVLVLSVPTLAWTDLHEGETPNLDRWLDQSAVADLSLRGVRRSTNRGDGYATVSAGTRAVGVAESGLAFWPDEEVYGGTAAAVYRRNTGSDQGDAIASLAVAALRSRNATLDFDAVLGSLGDALARHGVGRAVIANADERFATGGPRYQRDAVTALMDGRGTVPGGEVGPALTIADPLAPYGVRLDADRVVAAFEAAWTGRAVTLVEASDLARADSYRPLASEAQREVLRRDALAATDDLVGELVRLVDLERDAVLVVSPYHSSARVHLGVAGIRAPGLEPGLLRSASTRRSGFVTLVDVAPTIIELVGADRPASMEGRPFERGDRGGDASDRAATLVGADRAARFRDSMVFPVAAVFVALQLLVWMFAAWAITRRRSRARKLAAGAAVALLGLLPLTYLAGTVPFYRIGVGWYWIFVLGGATAVAGVASLAGRRHPVDPLLIGLGAVFGLLVLDMVLGAPLQLNTVFGYSPTVGGRFAGLGNLAFGQLAGAALLLCGLLVHRFGGGRGARAAGIAVLAVAVVIDGMPMWGSDVGGVLALVPAAGISISLLARRRLRWRLVALWGGATLVAIASFAAVDLSRPPDRRTHLGRLIETIGDEGFSAFETVVVRKLGANLAVVTSSIWTAMVPVVLAFVVFLLWRAPGRIAGIRRDLDPALAGLVVVGFLGFALNDSGIAVPGIMLGVVNATLVYLALRPAAIDEHLAGEPQASEP